MKFFSLLICTLFLLVFTAAGQNTINWNPESNLAPPSAGNNHPRMVVDRAGNPLAIWNNAGACMFARWTGAGFSSPSKLNPNGLAIAGADWMGPDIAAHGDTVYVVYKQTPENSSNSHIFCVYSYDGGVQFSAPVRVTYIADSLSRFPTVSTDDLGNPIVGFMKFDASFDDSRWAVSRSTDFGKTFLTDVKASGWSAPNAAICDCCPGAVACSGAAVAMLYRDNNSNIRDNWAGISLDTAKTFSGGMGIDQQNWFISACPATGPDGVIIGDTLYSTFANGASGKSLIYYNKSSISDIGGSMGIPISPPIAGLSQQNYARIDSDGKALAVAWMQIVNGARQGMLRFSPNILEDFPAKLDTFSLGTIINCDVAVANGNIYVVWQDNGSGSIKFRSGSYTPTSGLQENNQAVQFSIAPNPSTGMVHIESAETIVQVLVLDMLGKTVYNVQPQEKRTALEIQEAGLYLVLLKTKTGSALKKLVVTKPD